MNKEELLNQVNDIFKSVLDNTEIKIDYETNSSSVEDWDSLTHIQLVVAIEKHFDIRFTAVEIVNFIDVGEMCEAILIKLTNK